MIDLRKFFARNAARGSAGDHDPDSDYHPSNKSSDGLEVEYQGLIATQFRRWGISPSCTTVEVRRLGQAPDGYDVFVGMVRLTSWERDSAMRLLVGLPLLEAKVRKTVRATWLADFSHFGGLWLHASEQLHAPRELHDLLHQLVPLPAPGTPGAGTQTSSGYSISSLAPSSQPRSEPDEQAPVTR